MTATLLHGDCLETLKTLPAGLVQCVVTSPPYYGLRDYGNEKQIGLEETPEAYIQKLVDVFREVKRVLKDDGTLWLNLGDSYSGSSKGQGGKLNSPKQRSNTGSYLGKPLKTIKIDGCKSKDLMMIPARVALALQADGWYLRSEIVWHKPNPMPESVKDRPTRSHEMIYLLSKSQKYYYDAEAVLEPYTKPLDRWAGDELKADGESAWDRGTGQSTYRNRNMRPNPNGRNRRDVWTVTTKPYKGAHFATFPPDLIEPCILAGSAVGDVVLDPFNGSGTTGQVAIKYGRDYIGCELNPAYIQLTNERLEKMQPVLELV